MYVFFQAENNKLLEETYERHSHNVQLLQKELMTSIENISKAKNLESSAIDLLTNRGKDVNQILDSSETIIENLSKQQEQLQQYGDKLFLDRGNQFIKQENELKSNFSFVFYFVIKKIKTKKIVQLFKFNFEK